MGRSKKTTKGAPGYPDDASDSVSEISYDDSSMTSNISKSSALRSKFKGKFRKKKPPDTASVGSASGNSRVASQAQGGTASRVASSRAARTNTAPPPSERPSVSSGATVGTARSAGSATTARTAKSSQQADEKRLVKDAKSRFNIGLVYLKTGDYAKAQENLEHSLFCHIQLSGHDTKAYTNDTLFAIAGVREKLGDCYLANTAVVDKFQALDHYEEACRLLKSVAPEDAPDNVTEMLERVQEKLKQPELRSTERRKPVSARQTNKYQMEGNEKAKTLLGVGAGAGATAAAAATAKPRPPSSNKKRGSGIEKLEKLDVLGLKNGFGKIHDKASEFAADVKCGIHDVAEGILDVFDSDSSDEDASRKSMLSVEEADWFDTAMAHLERDNHRTALNYLTSLQEGGSMKSEHFRAQMADSMMKVAVSAMYAEKISVATDAYEEALAVTKQDEKVGDNRKPAMKGCIKGHKLLAMEMESIRDYSSAIQHRSRVYQLLDEDNRTVPACQQQVKIACLHGKKEDYAKCAVALSEAIRRLFRGVKSDMMPADRRDLLIQCYQMRAICYAKAKKWGDALKDYDELLPLVSKKEGQGSKQYNSALIHKSALLVTMGNHRLAASTVNKYLELALLSDEMAGNLIVDDLDHILALDAYVATQLKLGNVDKAISVFKEKLAFVKTLPNNAAMKSDTMHKLGCLLASTSDHESALPLLNEALNTRKYVHDSKHTSVLETTWAVAATNHNLGDDEKALKEYSVLLEKMTNGPKDMPVDSVIIHNSAGKLFFEDGQVDKAVHSFRQALHGAENPQLKAEITLNLANALSARGEADKAMELYTQLLQTKALKKTNIFYLTRVNKCLLLIKMGEVEEAKEILNKIVETRSSMANDVKGSIYLTLGNLAVSDRNIDEALSYFEKALDVAEDDDVNALAHAKRNIAMAYLEAGRTDKAISTLEDVLEDLSNSDVEGKSVNLLTAEIWNCLARVYKKKDDLSQAKNFAKLGKSCRCVSNCLWHIRYVSYFLFTLSFFARNLQRCKRTSQSWVKPILLP